MLTNILHIDYVELIFAFFRLIKFTSMGFIALRWRGLENLPRGVFQCEKLNGFPIAVRLSLEISNGSVMALCLCPVAERIYAVITGQL